MKVQDRSKDHTTCCCLPVYKIFSPFCFYIQWLGRKIFFKINKNHFVFNLKEKVKKIFNEFISKLKINYFFKNKNKLNKENNLNKAKENSPSKIDTIRQEQITPLAEIALTCHRKNTKELGDDALKEVNHIPIADSSLPISEEKKQEEQQTASSEQAKVEELLQNLATSSASNWYRLARQIPWKKLNDQQLIAFFELESTKSRRLFQNYIMSQLSNHQPDLPDLNLEDSFSEERVSRDEVDKEKKKQLEKLSLCSSSFAYWNVLGEEKVALLSKKTVEAKLQQICPVDEIEKSFEKKEKLIKAICLLSDQQRSSLSEPYFAIAKEMVKFPTKRAKRGLFD